MKLLAFLVAPFVLANGQTDLPVNMYAVSSTSTESSYYLSCPVENGSARYSLFSQVQLEHGTATKAKSTGTVKTREKLVSIEAWVRKDGKIWSDAESKSKITVGVFESDLVPKKGLSMEKAPRFQESKTFSNLYKTSPNVWIDYEKTTAKERTMTIIITATINEGGKEFTIECPKTILADRCEGKAGGACTEIA